MFSNVSACRSSASSTHKRSLISSITFNQSRPAHGRVWIRVSLWDSPRQSGQAWWAYPGLHLRWFVRSAIKLFSLRYRHPCRLPQENFTDRHSSAYKKQDTNLPRWASWLIALDLAFAKLVVRKQLSTQIDQPIGSLSPLCYTVYYKYVITSLLP